MKLILENDYELILTDSGEQCVNCVEKDESIGLVLLDIKMPKVSGLDILREIKEKRSNVNIVMVTDNRSIETSSEDACRDVTGHITKPFNSNEILKTISNISN